MSNRTRLLLVDGNPDRRAAISQCLSGSSLHVELFAAIAELIAAGPRDGVVLIHGEGEEIVPLIEHMGRTGTWLPVVAYAENPSPRRIVEAVHAGAIDYLAWPLSLEMIGDSVASAHARSRTRAGSRLREAAARSRLERLTRREREVLAGVADGLSNRMIGEKLAISPRTVEIHRANMLTKMGASHTSEAIRIAIEASLAA